MPRDLRLCAWGAPVALPLLLLALLPAAHLIPPLSPTLDPAGYQAFYVEHAVGIRVGAVLLMFGSVFFIPFFGAITAAMMRMEGRPAALAGTQLISGLLGIAPLYLGAMIFAAVSFRPERGADAVLALSDLGWLFLVMPAPAALIQLLTIGFAILGDRSARPVFPRWLGYFNFWVGILFQPGVLVPLFKHGPFAWDGLLAFWMPLGVFGIWVIVMFLMLLKLDEEPFGA